MSENRINNTLRLESVNGCPVVEYRVIDGHPVPYMVTVQRRKLTPDGGEYQYPESEWETVRIRDVLEHLQRDTPVAEWLRTKTRVDCSPERFARYADLDESAYMWNVNAR